jgi:starch-binding outer membrane protein, SusD/RagB family
MNSNKIIISLAASLLIITGCKKDFLEQKRDLTGVNEEVFKDPTLAKAYVDYIYSLFEPPANSQALIWELSSNGTTFSQNTEELAGETNWNKQWATISYVNANDLPYFGTKMTSSIGNNTWTRMKQINLFLQQIDKYDLTDDVKNPLKGQMYFWRAWQYFDLVKLYGGVPLILTPQDPIQSSGSENQVPRSKTSECIQQVVKDLDSATALLPGKWSSSDWGRITSGAAAAFKGRVLLTWASPLFNRNDDVQRWQRAYDANLAAKALLEANGFGLYSTGGTANAKAWGNMFTAQEVNNPEAVITFGFNNILSDQTQKWDGWEQAARPKQILGGGALSPTKQMVDAFPMKDGKPIGQSIDYPYDAKKFYKNRDPRFYKTFAYNGALWPYAQNANYRLWTYRWFSSSSAITPSSTTEQLGANGSGIYLAKATATNASNANGNFSTSGTDYMEMRFAEVLLNLAESAIGINKLSEGINYIGLVRQRAGIDNKDGAYGLSSATGRDQLFAAVLNERKIEFAYEGKRFWDLRRWMLFNDDYGTCTRLGVTPLNGMRRTGYYIYVKNTNGSKYIGGNNADPMYRLQNSTSTPLVAEREPATFPAGITNEDQYVDYLYDNYFEVTEKNDLDKTSPANWAFQWYDPYYFFGINQTVLSNSPYLEQTKGWDGLNGPGTFDPLQ